MASSPLPAPLRLKENGFLLPEDISFGVEREVLSFMCMERERKTTTTAHHPACDKHTDPGVTAFSWKHLIHLTLAGCYLQPLSPLQHKSVLTPLEKASREAVSQCRQGLAVLSNSFKRCTMLKTITSS